MKKIKNNKKKDIEAKLFLFLLKLKEEKNKEYSSEECEKNVAYLFETKEEFKNYFLQNGVDNLSDDLLGLCKMKTTKKGTIIALKGLCDHLIRGYNNQKDSHNNSHNIDLPIEKRKTNGILDGLGRNSIEDIINDDKEYPEGVYRPVIGVFESNAEPKGPVLSRKKK